MMIIEISEKKLSKLAENTEKMLKYGGKVMQCIEEMQEAAGGMGERFGGGYGNRNYGNPGGNFGNRYNGGYGNRHEEEDDDDEDFGERRGVKGTGPYARRYR